MVFDDPVTSLGLKEVADRLVLLAKSHQVIVFTHNIWLTTELLSQFDDNKDQCAYRLPSRAVRHEARTAGRYGAAELGTVPDP
jgi:hypothetical protein